MSKKSLLLISGLTRRWIMFQLKFKNYKNRSLKIFISKRSKIYSKTNVGFGTRINGPITIKGRGVVSIGRFCAIGDNVRLITQNHDVTHIISSLALQKKMYGSTAINPKSIEIGSNVWLGDNVLILPGVSIGVNTIVGAGAVVTKSLKANSVYGGNPAKLIRERKEIPSIESYDEAFWRQSDETIIEKLRRQFGDKSSDE